jgi:hypothetical protein
MVGEKLLIMYCLYDWSWDSSVSLLTRPPAVQSRNQNSIPSRDDIFCFFIALGLLSFVSSWYRRLFPHGGYCSQSVKLTTQLCLVLRLRMHRAVPPFPHTSSWHDTLAQGQLYFYLYVISFIVMCSAVLVCFCNCVEFIGIL